MYSVLSFLLAALLAAPSVSTGQLPPEVRTLVLRDSICALPSTPVSREAVRWPLDSAEAVAIARRALHADSRIEFPIRITRFERQRARQLVGLATAVRPGIRIHCGSGLVAIDSVGTVSILSRYTLIAPAARDSR